ncbi:DUF2490 domain-containing protein [Aquimarina sp. ERC-38]|uniref:DUF2490 domain-containing protein n=1 Tax=Aquimarina sp. ERC-38 TaxID=2949996 RepID=UPI002247B9A0|nr:DUF2490 domain-containing protein [Aquimarina sp. ERC-38]UZO79288.1 DUF2490 domain-containing protein [Aquimarina sp. ERC-38]
MLQGVAAQSNFGGFMQPQVTLEYKITPMYSHTNGIEERNSFSREAKSFWEVQQLDLFHFSQLRILDNQTLAIGIQYRFRQLFSEDKEDELRFTEQYSLTKRGFSVRYGHRLRTEQRISKEETIHRFRYRFMLDFPLKGQVLDIHELYIAFGTESLWSVASSTQPEFDQRLLMDFGWVVTKSISLELGIEHRIENYTNDVAQNLFINSSLNFSL